MARSSEVRDVDGASVIVVTTGQLVVVDIRGPRGGSPRVLRFSKDQAGALQDALYFAQADAS